MSSLQLPTLQLLASKIPSDISPTHVAQEWLKDFTAAIASEHSFLRSLFVEDGFWRDQYALSWDLRTIQGLDRILDYLEHHLAESSFLVGAMVKDQHRAPLLSKPLPEMVFLQLSFKFETAVGTGTGTCRLVNSAGIWKAYTLYTALEALKGFPEKTGAFRDANIGNGDWAKKRAVEHELAGDNPVVLIVGAGHTGLALGARLKALGVRALIVEQKQRVGDNWRNRYRTLSLHDPVWYNRMPCLNYPSTWPVYAPAPKLGEWLESFANSLELDVWTSSTVEHALWNEQTKTWTVHVARNGLSKSVEAKHLVLATGLGGGVPNMPIVPGQELFKGNVMHSTDFFSAEDYLGKRVVVVGAGSSGHDIAHDFANHEVDVTMFQRSATVIVSAKTFNAGLTRLYNEDTPVEVSDHLSVSLPTRVGLEFYRRIFPHLAATSEKTLLDGLEQAGFKTSLGPGNGGPLPLVYERAGGYYLDTGASQQIIDGKIKVKSGGEIERFTENGLQFSDGSELEADVVIFATGFGDLRDVAKRICGEQVYAKLGPVWGLTDEGELGRMWRECGQDNLWLTTGNLAMSRQYSRLLALRIKAEEEGLIM